MANGVNRLNQIIHQASNDSLFRSMNSLLNQVASEDRRRLELYIGTDREKLDEHRPPRPFYPSDVRFSPEVDQSVPADAIYMPSLSNDQARRLGVLFPSLTTLWIVVDGGSERRQVANFRAVKVFLEMLRSNLAVLRLADISMWPMSNSDRLMPRIAFILLVQQINEMANLKELSLSNADICLSVEESGLLLDLLLPRLKVLCIQSDHPETVRQLARSLLKCCSLSNADGSRLQLPAIYLKSNHLEINQLWLISLQARESIKELAFRPLPDLSRLTFLSTFSGVKCLHLNLNGGTFPWSNLCKELSLLEQLEHLSLTSYDFLVDVLEWENPLRPTAHHKCSGLRSIELVVDRLPSNGTLMESLFDKLTKLAPALQVLKLVDLLGCQRDHDLQELLFPLHHAAHLCYVIYYCVEKEKVFSKTQLEAVNTIHH